MLNDGNSHKLSIKYPNNPPEDYGVSKLQYTFDFINDVHKRDESIDSAIRKVADEYGLSESYLNDYLVENKYILDKTKKDDFSKDIKRYNTKSLKRILKKHGLKTSGKRDKIEKRIIDNQLLGNNYQLSSKSRVFYKNKKRRIRIYNEYLFDDYYFNEFNDFYMDNYRKREAKIPVAFINYHIDKSFEDKNHVSYISNCKVMAKHYLMKEKYRKMLNYVLMEYCMNLNPIWKISNLKGHVGIDSDTYDTLLFLNEKLSKNYIINTYYPIWDSFNFNKIIVPKYEGYRCLKDILNYKNYDKINGDLDKKFYSNDDLKIKNIIQKTLFDF